MNENAQARNVTGRPPGTAGIRAHAARHAHECIAALAHVVTDTAAPAAERVRAAEVVLDLATIRPVTVASGGHTVSGAGLKHSVASKTPPPNGEIGLKTVEIETKAPVQGCPHLYEMLALQEGVRMFRGATPADLSGFSDAEVLRMIRATCGRGGPCTSLADRIDADCNAILCALNAVGGPLRESRTDTGQ